MVLIPIAQTTMAFAPTKAFKDQYKWLSPNAGQQLYEPTPEDWRSFSKLSELQAATKQELHGVEIDFDIFENLAPADPNKRHAVYHAMDLNFQLRSSSKAVDAGVVIPTVNEDFVGKAPDLGALEVGKKPMRYGPTWITWQPFYR